MRLMYLIKSYLNWKHNHYVTFFCAGAGLELFMNFFHVGEISIYRTIKNRLSETRAQEQFEAERMLLEKVQVEVEDD